MPATEAQLRANRVWRERNIVRYRANMRIYAKRFYDRNVEHERERKLAYYYFKKERDALFAMYEAML